MSKKCDVCNSKIGLLNNAKISDGTICLSCTQLCSSYRTENISNMKKYFEINNQRKSIFKETQKLKGFASSVIHIDDNNRLFYIGEPKGQFNYIIYSYDEVLDYGYDVIEMNTVSKKKGGITRAVVGGAIAGPVGAIVGSSTAKTVSQTKPGNKTFYINVKTYSGTKKISIFNPPAGLQEFLCKCTTEKNNTFSNLNTIDEITKYKELFDKGIITEEEFLLKKKQLLNI